jgi:hypothetical protein
MKRKKARSIDLTKLARTSLISRSEAVQLVAAAISASPNVVSHRITYAKKKGHIKFEGENQIQYGRPVAWVQDTWPGALKAVEATRDAVVSPSVDITCRATLSCSGVGQVLPPDTLAGWRAHSERLLAENQKLSEETRALREENKSLQSEVALLRPFKLADERKRHDGRVFGKLARGVPKNREK